MKSEDKKRFLEIMNGCASAYRQTIEKPVISIYWEKLSEFEMDDVSAAFNAHICESKFFPSLSEIISKINDRSGSKHIGAEEAWAIALKSFDEMLPVVLTNEILVAKAIVQDIYNSGDLIGARMAFKEAYNRIILTAGDVRWFLTEGGDKCLNEHVVAQAVAMGRLPSGSEAKYRIEAPTTTVKKLTDQAHEKTGKVDALAMLGMYKSILVTESSAIADREKARLDFEDKRNSIIERAMLQLSDETDYA